MRALKIGYVLLGILLVAAGVATVLARRAEPISAVEQALGRGLVPGMPLAEATALLRRLDVAFTVDSTADGTTVVKYGRQVARDGGRTTIKEQQIHFDAQGRLRDMLTASQITSE